MSNSTCFHCGDPCAENQIILEEKSFCCNGCKTVYQIFEENDLTSYYELERSPGSTPTEVLGKFDFLDDESIKEKLLEFSSEDHQIIELVIPGIHCSACIWVLENLNKLLEGVSSSQVNFNRKTLRVSYNPDLLSLKTLVESLSRIGYEPTIKLDSLDQKNADFNRKIYYQLGVAGFAFGNVMLHSFPEYFEVEEYWLEQYKPLFRWIMFAFSVPVVFYAAQDYFISAYKGLRRRFLNIDLPIALGISVLFIRSTVDIAFDLGSGFFDSLTGLVFFLLLGKFFQQRTYSFLSFERDYKSYFPIAVTKKESNGSERPIQVKHVKKGDRLVIRNSELIPVDAILLKGEAAIDYSFVTGESAEIIKKSGDKIFAGGKQCRGAIEIEALKTIDSSYLTQLWSHDGFNKNEEFGFKSITDSISKHFTIVVLSIAFIATTIWLFIDPSKAMNVFTAVLIIACPCAIALAAPFTLGHMLRIYGKMGFYLKNSIAIEKLASLDMLVFDKTGTISTTNKTNTIYSGEQLTEEEQEILKGTLRGSSHPLSVSLYDMLKELDISTPDQYVEVPGKGIMGTFKNDNIKIGSAEFVGATEVAHKNKTMVHLSCNNQYKGYFTFGNHYRKGLNKLFRQLKDNYELIILSGDNDGEQELLSSILPSRTKLIFNQSPTDKLDFIHVQQKAGYRVGMIGDGLNDAGALKQSDLGLVISENINSFSPACDGILNAENFWQLNSFLSSSKAAVRIIKWSFLFSLFYNIIGLGFAVTANLEPVIAAILMPLSSISIVVFTTLATGWLGRKLNRIKQ